MKRIKLFEAFNDPNKIAKVTFLLFCWCFESFIKEKIKDGSFEFITNIPPRFIVSDTDSGTYLLIYDFYQNSVTSFNMYHGRYNEYLFSLYHRFLEYRLNHTKCIGHKIIIVFQKIFTIFALK